MRLLKDDPDFNPGLQRENEKMKNVMRNLGDIIAEQPYDVDNEEKNGLLNCSRGQISDFKVTLASAIAEEYRYIICKIYPFWILTQIRSAIFHSV